MALQTTVVAMQWLSSDHVVTPTDTNTTTEDGVFYAVHAEGIYSENQLPLVSQSREGLQSVSQSVEGCRSWGQFRNSEEWEFPPLEAATKQRSEDRD
jgi:hypothetical protein